MKSLLLQIVIFLSVLFVVTADNDINSAVKSPNFDKESHESSGCDEHDKLVTLHFCVMRVHWSMNQC